MLIHPSRSPIEYLRTWKTVLQFFNCGATELCVPPDCSLSMLLKTMHAPRGSLLFFYNFVMKLEAPFLFLLWKDENRRSFRTILQVCLLKSSDLTSPASKSNHKKWKVLKVKGILFYLYFIIFEAKVGNCSETTSTNAKIRSAIFAVLSTTQNELPADYEKIMLSIRVKMSCKYLVISMRQLVYYGILYEIENSGVRHSRTDDQWFFLPCKMTPWMVCIFSVLRGDSWLPGSILFVTPNKLRWAWSCNS